MAAGVQRLLSRAIVWRRGDVISNGARAMPAAFRRHAIIDQSTARFLSKKNLFGKDKRAGTDMKHVINKKNAH
jgi:hypothetical protein